MASEQIEINVVVGGLDSLKDVSLALRNITLAMTDNIRFTKNMDARQRALNQALGETRDGTGEYAKNLLQAVRNQATLNQAVRETTQDLARLKKEMSMGRGGPGLPNLVKDLQKAQKNMDRLRPRLLISDLRSISMQIRKMGKDLQFVGRSLIIGLTTPILGFATKGLSAMYALEKQLVQLVKVIGDASAQQTISKEEIDNFKKFGYEVDASSTRLDAINQVLKDTSLELGISRDALTAITGDFAQLGVTSADTLSILTKTAAEVSVLGAMDLDASQELSQTLFLGLQRALDKRGEVFENAAAKQAKATTLLRSQIYLFNAVENATAMSFRDISEALPEISAAVTEFGLSFMEGLAITAPIKAAGIQTSVAANAIKMSLQRLTAPTITATKHMEGLKNEMQDIIAESPVLEDAFDNIFGIGATGLQALIDITSAVGAMEDGAAKSMAMYSKLFDKRQSTRMKIAIDDLVSFQKEMTRMDSGTNKLIKRFNEWSSSASSANGATVPMIKNVKDLTTVAKLASSRLLTGETFVEIGGTKFYQRDIDAAKEARKDLQKYFKDQFRAGNNIIKDISQESGKVLFTQLIGAGGAVELAQSELDVAKNSISVTIDRIKIALKEISITFIEDFKPVIESVADSMLKLSDAISNMDPALRKAIVMFAGFVASVGPAVFILGQVKLAIGVLTGTFLKLVPGLANLTIEQVSVNKGLQRLRHGLTMTGGTVINTNSRFATLIATLAGGKGATAAFANRFGTITGILKKTKTMAADVNAAIEETTILGQRALSSASARVVAAKTPAADMAAKKAAAKARTQAVKAATSYMRVAPDFVPDPLRFSSAFDRAGISMDDLKSLESPIPSVREMINQERTRLIRAEMPDRDQIRLAKNLSRNKRGAIIAKGPGGKFRSPTQAEIIAFEKLEDIRKRATDYAMDNAEKRQLLERKVENVTRSQIKKTENLRKQAANAQAKAIASNAAADQAAIADRIRKGRGGKGMSSAVGLDNIAKRKRIQSLDPFFKKVGITADAKTGTFMRRGREITQERAELIARGGARGRLAGIAQTLTPVGSVAKAPVKGVKAIGKGAGAVATSPIKAYRSSVKKAAEAVQFLNDRHTELGGKAPRNFKKVGVSIKALIPNIFSVGKAFKLLRIIMIKTGIGAIIVGVIAIIAIFVKNWDKIKEKAKPVLDALNYAWGAMKKNIESIVRPFMEFFSVLGKGSDDGAGAVGAIGKVFEWLSGAIRSTADAVTTFVNNKLVPFLRLGLGAVLSFADGVKGLVKAFIAMFKGGSGATSMLRESIMKMFTSVLQFMLGVFAPGLVDILAQAIKISIKVLFGLVSATGVVVGMIINLFAQMSSGIIELLVKAVSKGLGLLENIPGLNFVASGLDSAVKKMGGAASGIFSAIGKTAAEIGKKVTDSISGPLSRAGDSASEGIDSIAAALKQSLKKFAPKGTDAAGGYWAGWKEKSEKEGPEITEEILDTMVDQSGDAGADAAQEFANRFEEQMNSLRQKFVDLVLGIFDQEINNVTQNLVDALDKQKEAALEIFEQQLDTIEKLQKAEEALTRQKEYMADRRRLIDERELNRQNYVRNRALAIYEGRIDDARMLDLEERKSKMDSAQSISDLDNKMTRDLAKENIEFIKDQIKKTKEESDKFFKDQIEAFKEAAKQITKFAPQTIEEYESQLNQLTELARKAAQDNGAAFAETFEKMSQEISTQIPNIGAGVFTENLQDLIDIAREKYGLGSPSENSIVGATIAMLSGVSTSIQKDGVVINKSMFDMLQFMKTEVVDKTLSEINAIFLDKNPHKILAEAIYFANETIRREFERTVGHVISNVDNLAKAMDPFIEKVVRAQMELEALRQAAAGGGGGGGGSDTGPGPVTGPGNVERILDPLAAKQKRLQELATQLQGLKGAPRELQVKIQAEYDKLKAEIEAAKKNPLSPGVAADLSNYQNWVSQVLSANKTNPIPTAPLTPPPGWSGSVTPAPRNAASSASSNWSEVSKKYLENFEEWISSRATSPVASSTSSNWTELSKQYLKNFEEWLARTTAPPPPPINITRPVGPVLIPNPGSEIAPGWDLRPIVFQNGGFVPGVKSAAVPTILHGGEFVVNSKAVSNIGLAALQSMNNMRFNTPGKYSGPKSSTQVTETHNYNIYVDNFIGEDQWFESMMKNYNMKVVPRNQKNAGLQSRSISTYSGINRGM